MLSNITWWTTRHSEEKCKENTKYLHCRQSSLSEIEAELKMTELCYSLTKGKWALVFIAFLGQLLCWWMLLPFKIEQISVWVLWNSHEQGRGLRSVRTLSQVWYACQLYGQIMGFKSSSFLNWRQRFSIINIFRHVLLRVSVVCQAGF